jgi:hypothetical protein
MSATSPLTGSALAGQSRSSGIPAARSCSPMTAGLRAGMLSPTPGAASERPAHPILRSAQAMSDHVSSPGISRRSLLRGGAAAVPVAAGLLPSFFAAGCTAGPASATPRAPSSPPRPGTGIANVHVSHDHYGVHVEPSVAANPAHPRQLLAACQASPTANPELIATYLSFDAGASWQNGALPQPPAGQAPASDDVTVAFDSHGRGYLCASRAGNTPGGRAMYVWRTDDGGRSFSAPVTLVAGQYFDHPGIAVGIGQAPSEHNVYVVWAAAGNSPSARPRLSASPAPPTADRASSRRARSCRGPRTLRKQALVPSLPPDRMAWCAPPATGQPCRTRPET